MDYRKRLIVSISNHNSYGIMNIEFAKEHFDKLFPDEDIQIMEESELDKSIIPLYERKNGEWYKSGE